MVALLKTGHVDPTAEFASNVRGLLNDAFPEGAPDELNHYYARRGIPDVTLLLTQSHRIVGHLALYERDVHFGNEPLRVGLLGEIAIAADCRRRGLAYRLVEEAHAELRARSIPFSILFAFEPRVYASSGYKLMQNETRFLETDGTWKTVVYHGSMYAELSAMRWPNRSIDLCGPVV
jgi:predicted acetyltransferase